MWQTDRHVKINKLKENFHQVQTFFVLRYGSKHQTLNSSSNKIMTKILISYQGLTKGWSQWYLSAQSDLSEMQQQSSFNIVTAYWHVFWQFYSSLLKLSGSSSKETKGSKEPELLIWKIYKSDCHIIW